MISNWRDDWTFLMKLINRNFQQTTVYNKNQISPTLTSHAPFNVNRELEISSISGSMKEKDNKVKLLELSGQTKCRCCGKMIARFSGETDKNTFIQEENDQESCKFHLKDFRNWKKSFADKVSEESETPEKDMILFGKCYKRVFDETSGAEKWYLTGTVQFSLEKCEWMKCKMSNETRDMFLNLLFLKQNLKKTLNCLEEQVLILKEKIRILSIRLKQQNLSTLKL